jgi:HlyD family secretion protein
MNRSWIWTVGILIAIAAISYALFRALQPQPLPPGIVYGNGHIEGTEVRVASEVAGRVVEQRLIEGQTVEAGQTLVVVDPETSRDQVGVVQGEIDALERSAAALDAQIATWSHHAQTARQQAARMQILADGKLVSRQSLDTASDAARQADGELRQLRAQRNALDANVASAQARLQLARTQVERTTVAAPQDGTVLVRAVEVGEVIQAGQPLALLADLQRLELKVYLPIADAGKVKLDNPARVRVDAFPDRDFDARVARIDAYAQFTPRDIHVPAERTQTVYGVTLALNNADAQLKPGMPADAWIRWDPAQPWPGTLPIPRD